MMELSSVDVQCNTSFLDATHAYMNCQGDVWICMELMDSSMDKISEKVYNQLNQRIPEDILGKMTVAVSGDDPLPTRWCTRMYNDPLPTLKSAHACVCAYTPVFFLYR